MFPFRPDSIDELLATCTPGVRRLAQAARKRVLAVVPGATEKLRPGWGLIGYNAPAYFAYVLLMRDHVRIGFEWGVSLPDPEGLLEGSGRQVRHVTIRRPTELRSRALADLLGRAAVIGPPGRTTREGGRSHTTVRSLIGERGVAQSKMFGFDGLTIGGKFFALTFRGNLVVKLPPGRVEVLVSEGKGERFNPYGRVKKEWVVLGEPQESWG